MSAKRILVPVDFTMSSNNAIKHAAGIASRAGDGIKLLHVLVSKQADPTEKDQQLTAICDDITAEYDIPCEFETVAGDVLENIIDATGHPADRMMVIGSHGTHGFLQSLFGSHMLKIAKRSADPTLVIPEDGTDKYDYKTIVFPYGGQDHFEHKIDATATLAGLFGSTVHIYSIQRPLEEISVKAMTNIDAAKAAFADRNIDFKEVKEEAEGASIGFAEQTLRYAKKVDAAIIAVMAQGSQHHSYISEADKERLLNNKDKIAILMTSK